MYCVNFKKSAVATTLLLVALLGGCDKKEGVLVEPTVASLPVTAVKPNQNAKPNQNVKLDVLGLYTGQFDPSDAYLKAKKEYEDGNFIDLDLTSLEDVPASLHPYLYKTPLNGLYQFTAPNRLTLVLNDIREDGSFVATSVAAGNQREVKGTWEKTDRGIHLIGKEPGNSAVDGGFDVLLLEKEKMIVGTWTSHVAKAKPKKFALKKFDFEYDSTLGQRLDKNEYFDFGNTEFAKNPSVDLLKTPDVENLTQPQIRVIRNLIFARHGYSFKTEDLRRTFENYDWYTPTSNDIQADLSELEKKNLALLARYEKYADKHYDEFGR